MAVLVEDLEDELRLDDVDPVTLRAAESGRAELGHPGVVERLRAVRGLDGRARRGDASAGLARVDRAADARICEVEAELFCHVGEAERISRRAQKGGRVQV